MRIQLIAFLLLSLQTLGAVDTVRFKALEKKARASYGSNLDSSIYYCQKILAICEKEEDYPEMHAFALNWTGICLMRQGFPDSAESLYQQTIKYGLNNNASKFVQMARLNRSINYFQQGKYEKSADAAEESLKSFETIGDSLGMAHAQYNSVSYTHLTLPTKRIV